MPRSLPLLGLLLAVVAPAPGQLPYLTAPVGTLRIDLGGGFLPATQEFADGTRRGLGDPIDPGAVLQADLVARLDPLLGRPSTPASIGTFTADLMHQRGEGVIGLALGITSRLTVAARVPVVSVRTESRLSRDGTEGTLGLNPALAGDGTSAAWLEQFGSALDELRTRRDAGEYANDPPRLALANTLLAEAPTWREQMASLLVAPGEAAMLLPLATSVDGAALLSRATDYRDELGGTFGLVVPQGTPLLPAAALSDEQFGALLGASEGFGLAPVEEQPIVGIGDVVLDATYLLRRTSDPTRRRWFATWLTGGVTLPTGTAPRADRLRDQGTGDGQLDVAVGGVVDLGRGRLGLRAEAGLNFQLAGGRETRIARRDEFLVPAARTATLDWDPGDIVSLTARPYVRIADRLALTGMVSWFRRGEDAWSPPSGPGDDALDAMGTGTGAEALRLGLGLGYAHDGRHVDGVVRMPLEAGLGVERVAWSGSGLESDALVTRVWFRVYKRLW